MVEGTLPESVFKSLDIVAVCRSFYDGIGLPVDDVLRGATSTKNRASARTPSRKTSTARGTSACCRTSCPTRSGLPRCCTRRAMAIFQICRSHPPYALHTDAHPLCTEGVAMMFERFGHNVDWLLAMGARIPEPDRYRAAAAKLQRNRMLIFARDCQALVRFERELYRNPNQDLNRLWWDLAEKYQEVKRPEAQRADFAAKIHIVTAPVYYHNYMLGEMFASQVHHALIRAVGSAGGRSCSLVPCGNDLRRQQGGRRVHEASGCSCPA